MSRPTVLLLSGPNLTLLGIRDPEVYGTNTLDDHVKLATETADGLGLDVEHHQSDREGELVERIQGARGRVAAIVINAAAYTHSSWAIHDALATFDGPIVELHISNPERREAWRRTSVVTPVATAVVCGFGGDGYRLAIEGVGRLLAP